MRPQNVHPEDLVRVSQIDLRGDRLSQDPDELELVVVALSGPDIVRVPITDAVKELKTLDPRIYEVAATFFG